MQAQENVSAIPQDPKKKLERIEAELNEVFLEREEQIRGLLCALLAEENVLLLGLKGAAKTRLAGALCESLDGASYFKSLLSRFSTPEQLLGPYSVKGLENDSYTRKTAGYLPGADVAFVDEIFKANSAVLNELLPVLEDRVFFDDGREKPVPLKMLVGASNELPHDRRELDALWDRFMVRMEVSYLSDAAFCRLLTSASFGRAGSPAAARTRLTPAELEALRSRVARTDTTAVIEPLIEIRRRLGEARIVASDRRYVKSLKVVAAQALMSGRDAAMEEDLQILADVLWEEPSQSRQVRKVVMEIANPALGAALDLMDEAQEIYEKALSAAEEEKTAAGTDANSNLKRIQNRLLSLRTEALTADRSTERIDASLARVQAMIKEVLDECLGLNL